MTHPSSPYATAPAVSSSTDDSLLYQPPTFVPLAAPPAQHPNPAQPRPASTPSAPSQSAYSSVPTRPQSSVTSSTQALAQARAQSTESSDARSNVTSVAQLEAKTPWLNELISRIADEIEQHNREKARAKDLAAAAPASSQSQQQPPAQPAAENQGGLRIVRAVVLETGSQISNVVSVLSNAKITWSTAASPSSSSSAPANAPSTAASSSTPPPSILPSFLPREVQFSQDEYARFLERLACAPEIARYIDTFAVQFNAGSPVVESTPQPSASACARESPAVEPTSTGESLRLKQSAQVNKIIDTARVMIRNHPAFAAYLPTVTSVTLNNCLESYVARLVYAKAFQPSNEIDAVMERDARLYDKIARFRFVTLQHLEISERLVSLPRNQPTLEQAQEWLLRLTRLKTPLEKMQAILQCCYMIYSVLQSNMATTRSPSRAKQPSAQQPGGECGADCFVPVLVYVILKANPPCLFSNIEYLSMYRHRSLLTGESAYYFVTFAGAVAFIENLDHTSLKLTSSEYLEHFGSAVNHGELLQAIRAVPQESSNKPADSQQPPQEPQPQQQQQQQQLIFDPLPPLDQPQPPAIEEEPAAPTPTPDQVAVAPEQEASSTESSKPESPEIEWTAPASTYRFIATKSIDELSRQELEQLLAEYKRLAQVEWSLKQEAMNASSLQRWS